LKYVVGAPFDIALNGEVANDYIVLTWTPMPSACSFWVYDTFNIPYFEPGFSGVHGTGYLYRLDILPTDITTWSSSNGIGDPNENWTYLVITVDATEQVLACSDRVGEQDFEGDITE